MPEGMMYVCFVTTGYFRFRIVADIFHPLKSLGAFAVDVDENIITCT
jgi:hypothetical protein